MLGKVAGLEESLDARDAVIRSIVKDSCATLEPSLRGLIENFRADPDRSMSEAFCVGSTGSQFHADTAIDGITFRFSRRAATDDDGGFAKGEDVFDRVGGTEVIEL